MQVADSSGGKASAPLTIVIGAVIIRRYIFIAQRCCRDRVFTDAGSERWNGRICVDCERWNAAGRPVAKFSRSYQRHAVGGRYIELYRPGGR